MDSFAEKKGQIEKGLDTEPYNERVELHNAIREQMDKGRVMKQNRWLRNIMKKIGKTAS